MNSNFLNLILLNLLFVGCGVKSDPVPPPGTQLPTYIDKFLDKPDKQEKEKENNKNEKLEQP